MISQSREPHKIIYRVFFNEGYTKTGYKMLIFKSKIIIFWFLSFTTPMRFVLYSSYPTYTQHLPSAILIQSGATEHQTHAWVSQTWFLLHIHLLEMAILEAWQVKRTTRRHTPIFWLQLEFKQFLVCLRWRCRRIADVEEAQEKIFVGQQQKTTSEGVS